jgi:hypothetical protein
LVIGFIGDWFIGDWLIGVPAPGVCIILRI